MSDSNYSDSDDGGNEIPVSGVIKIINKMRKTMERRLDAIEAKIHNINIKVYDVFCETCDEPIIEPPCCAENTDCADCTSSFECEFCNTTLCYKCSHTQLYRYTELASPRRLSLCKNCSDKFESKLSAK